MIKVLSTGEAADVLVADSNANWTYPGARALVEYLDELDPSMELDIVALRCEYSEYESLEAWYVSYHNEGVPDGTTEDDIREEIQNNTTLIEFDGGIIVGEF